MRYQNLVRSLRQIDRIVIRKPKQDREHADMDVDQISDPFAHQRTRVTRELLAPLEQNQVERFFGADVTLNELFDLSQQVSVV